MGKRWSVDLGTDAQLNKFTVKQLKEKLETDHGLAVEDQVLRFKSRQLDDEETLASCGITSGSSLLLGLTMTDEKAGETKDGEGSSTKTAYKPQSSQTMTVAEETPDGGTTAPSEPWWTTSRISGPQGGYRPVSAATTPQ